LGLGKTELIVVFLAVLVLFVGINSFENAEAIKSKGNSLTETTSKQVCGNFMCDEPMSIVEKIAAYLLSLAQLEEPETNILQQAFLPGSFGGERMASPIPPIGERSFQAPDLRMGAPQIGAKTFKSPDVKMASPQIGAKTFKSLDVKPITTRDVKASKLAGDLIKKFDLKQDRLSPAVAKIAEKFQPTLDRDKLTQMRIAQQEQEKIQSVKQFDRPIVKKGEMEVSQLAEMQPQFFEEQSKIFTSPDTPQVPPEKASIRFLKDTYTDLYEETEIEITCPEMNQDSSTKDSWHGMLPRISGSYEGFYVCARETGANTGIFEATCTSGYAPTRGPWVIDIVGAIDEDDQTITASTKCPVDGELVTVTDTAIIPGTSNSIRSLSEPESGISKVNQPSSSFQEESETQTQEPSHTYNSDTSIFINISIPAGEIWVIESGVTVTVNDVGHLHNSGTLIIKSDGKLVSDSRQITNNAEGIIENSGELEVKRSGSLVNFGTINNKADGWLVFRATSFSNRDGGVLNNAVGGIITITEAAQQASSFSNLANGIINNFGTITEYTPSFVSNSGTINNNSGAELNLYSVSENKDNGIINNHSDGTITVGQNGSLIISGGTINNSGTIKLVGIVNNNVSPPIIKRGLIIVDGGTINNNSGGLIDNRGASTITINSDSTITNHSIIKNDNPFIDSPPVINNSGAIINDCGGVVNGPVTGNQPIDIC